MSIPSRIRVLVLVLLSITRNPQAEPTEFAADNAGTAANSVGPGWHGCPY